MSLKYDDFDLQIERAGEKYRVRLLNAPTGQATGEFVLPFSEIEVGNFLSRIGQVRRSMRRVDMPELHAAKEFGGRLFSAIFCGEMIAQLRGSIEQSVNSDRGLRIRLRLTDVPELADLPWEFLYDQSQNHFLTTSTETPVVRFLDLPQRIAPLRATLPLRLLVMIAGPRNLKRLDAEGEWERLQDALSDLVKGGHLIVERLPSATLDALRLRARGTPFHIFHFIGHGGFDNVAEDGVLQFEDEAGMSYPVRGEMLGMQLHDHRSLRLAVLNACEGARSSRQDPFSGVAQSLLQQRVPAVIAMQFEISDIAAKVFAREFYRAIAEGNPVDAAVCESRKALFKEEYGQEWATPVLYMRSQEGALFDLQPGTTAGVAPDIGSGQRPVSPAERQSGERAAAESAAVAEKARLEGVAREEREEAARRHVAAREADAARVAAFETALKIPETVIAPANLPPDGVDAETQAAALVGSAQSARSDPAATRTSGSSAPAEVSRSSSRPARQAPVAHSPVVRQQPPRMHIPVWLVLLIAVPLIGAMLALSWHHLRGHDDDHGGGTAAQSGTPVTQKPDDTAPAKTSSVTPVSGPASGPERLEVRTAPNAIEHAKSEHAKEIVPGRIRVAGAEQAKKLMSQVAPTYPPLARQAKIRGVVQLHIVVAKDGSVASLNVISGHPLLIESAIDAVKQWRYAPTLVGDHAVEVDTIVDVIYTLKE